MRKIIISLLSVLLIITIAFAKDKKNEISPSFRYDYSIVNLITFFAPSKYVFDVTTTTWNGKTKILTVSTFQTKDPFETLYFTVPKGCVVTQLDENKFTIKCKIVN
jgi:hypothetical protein